MRIIIDMGHTPTSPGASGYLDELTCDRIIGRYVIAELERRGHTVYNSTPADWVSYPQEVNDRCAFANSLSNIDLFCSLHLNAGGGHGAEVLYYAGDSQGYEFADILSRNVADALGITNRGAKANDWVGVIRNVNHTSVLIEFCFVDSYEDYLAWNRCSMDDLAKAVCDGIEKTEGEDMPTPEDVWGYNWENTAPQGNMYNCNVAIFKMVESMERKIDSLNSKIDKIQSGNVDYAKLAKAVNDDMAARMKQ